MSDDVAEPPVRAGRALRRLLGGRDLVLLADTALISASSVLLLIIAARALPPAGLTAFALAQPLVATAVGLQRITLLAPALVVQRRVGRGRLPLDWIGRVAVPVAVVLAAVAALTLGLSEGRVAVVAVVLAVVGTAALTQDILRYRMLSSGRVRSTLVSDASVLAVTAAAVLLVPVLDDWLVLLGAWGAALVVGSAIGLGVTARRTGDVLPAIRIRDTWTLGRWSGLDGLMGTVAYLLPLYISSLVLNTAFAGVYRVLQAANGPLNILDTAITTSFGLDAWRTTSPDQIRALQARVRKLVVLMALLAAGYLVIAEVAIIVLSGVESPDLARIATIVLIAGLLGSVTTPLSAASLALGFQKGGAVIRVVAVVVSLLISAASVISLPLPWNDPIGTIALFAPVATGLGWFFFYRKAVRAALRAADRPSA